ncbi:hypothetical protein PGT21_017100 [Puccinia graminis f. sp. tritici]|uniref:Uncharacterized protein n=1 Tax=Puccinia graminis f. sp. tritici TaxID=56615 RepID=A0A5B0PJX9_PUCGR|nr:hypothetical protein PGT21_017100 [Puccinia graminis f. sp. tritici]
MFNNHTGRGRTATALTWHWHKSLDEDRTEAYLSLSEECPGSCKGRVVHQFLQGVSLKSAPLPVQWYEG